jgi:hypothetical protein
LSGFELTSAPAAAELSLSPLLKDDWPQHLAEL